MAGIDVESGATDKAYPEVFDIRAMIPQTGEKKPGQLSAGQLKQYFEEVRINLYFVYCSFAFFFFFFFFFFFLNFHL